MRSIALENLNLEFIIQLIDELIAEIGNSILRFANYSDFKDYVFRGKRNYDVNSINASYYNN